METDITCTHAGRCAFPDCRRRQATEVVGVGRLLSVCAASAQDHLEVVVVVVVVVGSRSSGSGIRRVDRHDVAVA